MPRKTFKKKTTAKKKGSHIYKVKGGWRVSHHKRPLHRRK